MTSPNSTYITASVFSLAHPYGTPTVLSSFSYTSYDDGAPNNGEILICWLLVFLWLKVVFITGSGTCDTAGGKNGWYCQHRLTAISGMVGFRNAVGSAPMTNWTSPQSQQIAFGRGFILHYFRYGCSTDFFFLFEALLDLWQSITSILSGLHHFLLRFLTVNIVMWLAGQVRLESVPVQRTWYFFGSLIFFFLTLVCIQYHRIERFIHRFYTRSRCCRYSYSCYRRQICCCDLQTNWFSWIYWVHLRCYFSSIFTSTALLSFLDFHWLKDSDKVLCKIWIPVHSFFGFSSLSIISWWTFTDRLFIFLMLIY